MFNTIRGYIKDNEEFKKKFDKLYTHENADEGWKRGSLFDIIQIVMLVLAFVSVVGGLLCIWAFGLDKPAGLWMFGIGILIFLIESVILRIKLLRHSEFDKKMKWIDNVISEMYIGYKDMDIANKCICIENFDARYRKAFSVKVEYYGWKIIGYIMQVETILFGIITNLVDWKNISEIKLIV